MNGTNRLWQGLVIDGEDQSEPSRIRNAEAAPAANGEVVDDIELPAPIQCGRASVSHAIDFYQTMVPQIVIPEGINNLAIPEAARFYIEEFKLPVIPLYPISASAVQSPGKQPMIRDYRQKKVADMTDHYLSKWFPPRTDRNLGGVLPPSLVWIDLDAKQDEGDSAREWLDRHPEFQKCPRVRTKHGLHIPCLVNDLPDNTKKLVHTVNDKLVIEVLTPPHPITLPPSLRSDGVPYRWETYGPVEEDSWSSLLIRLGASEKKPGRPRKPLPLSQKFKGDLNTLNLLELLHEKQMLGPCLDENQGKFAIRCPWEREHSSQHEDIRSDTAVWRKHGKVPRFRCLHAHCEDRRIQQLLEWLESQDPGVVDRFCAERRAYGPEENESKGGQPLVEHAGDGRLISEVGQELASIIAPMHRWFQRNGGIVEVKHDSKTGRLVFQAVSPDAACGGVEQFVVPVVPKKFDDEEVMVPRSFSAREIAPLLCAPQFITNLPTIDRILPVRLPILNSDGKIVRPLTGYDPSLRTYLRPDAPEIEVMTVDEAKKVIDDLFGDFCFSSHQDRVHAIARLITPYARGIMGWTARVPLWLFIANRPRAGKDYLAGVVIIAYTGELLEDAPLEKGSEETRKRITAALMSGRQFMHLANCQGHINDAMLIGAITARVIRVRNLGSTAAEADLELPNEMEFSLSANLGVTYREDIEPRTRRISLAFFDEDPNKRTFRHSDLHAYVLAHRGKILGAVDALVSAWISQGSPPGPTPFTSFPEWAKVVGGIMQVNGLGDPCLPHDSELELGGDLKERAMRAVFRLGYAKWPDKWVAKEDLFKLLAETDDEDLSWFGPWTGEEAKGTRNKAGMALKAYNQRILACTRLRIEAGGKGASQKVRFEAEDGGETSKGGNLGNLGNLLSAGSHEKPNPNDNRPSEIDNSTTGDTDEVSEVSKVSSPPYSLVSDVKELAAVVAALSDAPSVALDTETYGPEKGDALSPRKGRIRLLQLAVPNHDPWLIDIMAVGTELGALKTALESCEVIAHNARFDLGFLREHLGIALTKVYCTMTASQLLTAGTSDKNDLFSCLERHLDIPPYADESRSGWAGEMTQAQLAYAASDVLHLHRLREALDVQLDQRNLRRVVSLEMELLPVVVDIEAAGMPIDIDRLEEQIAKAREAADQARNAIRERRGRPDLNPNSVSQVKAMLSEEGFDLQDTREETLAANADHELVALLLKFRQQAKLASMLENLRKGVDADGRLRASFNPLGTCTGRFSCVKPNLQNIPRGQPRTIVKALTGCSFVRADYGQIELRVAAALTGDARMLEAFRNGEDLHKLTAAFVTGKEVAEITKQERQEAKAVNFGFIYGQGADGFRKRARAEYGLELTKARAEELRTAFFETYPAFSRWHKRVWREVEGGVTETRTRTGRQRLIPKGVKPWNCFTALVNTPVQGLGADGMKYALIRLYRELPVGAQVILTVHDDVLVECPEALTDEVKALVERILTEEMSNLLPEVPIDVEAEVLTEWK